MATVSRFIVLATVALALQGCLAKTALDVVTTPVKVVSRGTDLATTSQSEADQKRGREIRRREQELARLDKDLRKQEDDCLGGNDASCRKAVSTRRQIEVLLPAIPVEPRR